MFRLTFKPSSVYESTFDIQAVSVDSVKHPKHIRMSYGRTLNAARAACAQRSARSVRPGSAAIFYYISCKNC